MTGEVRTKEEGMDVVTVKDIAYLWLLRHGYDGLCSGECGCDLHDLMCCAGPTDLCEAARKADCESCAHGPEHNCDCDYNDVEADYMMFVGGTRCDYERAGGE